MICRPKRFLRLLASAPAVLAVSALSSSAARAAGSNMPWEQPLNQILQSVEGPVAKILAVIVIIITGLTLAFGDTSGGFRRLIQIVFGLSIAFAASSFFLSFFSFGGGALVRCTIPSPAFPFPCTARLPSRSCSAERRAASPFSSARWRRRSASVCACGSPVSLSGRSAMPPLSGRPNAIRCSSMSCAITCAFPATSQHRRRP